MDKRFSLFVLSAASCTNGYSTHYLEQDELISTLAGNCSVDPMVLKAANPQIADINKVFPGQPVCVPAACCDGKVVCASSGSSPAPTPSPPTRGSDAGKVC